jgi:hypothetical protein
VTEAKKECNLYKTHTTRRRFSPALAVQAGDLKIIPMTACLFNIGQVARYYYTTRFLTSHAENNFGNR